MRLGIPVIAVLLVQIASGSTNADEPLLSATIKSISQLHGEYRSDSDRKPLNLSGVLSLDGRVFVVGDKSKDKCVYRAEYENGYWHLRETLSLDFRSRSSLEGIAGKGDALFTVNEQPSRIYAFSWMDNALKRDRRFSDDIEEAIEAFGISMDGWKNEGFEGIAFDGTSKTLYLAKERGPRFILAVSIKKAIKVISKFDVTGTTFPDSERELGSRRTFSGLSFRNGHLYALERRGYTIVKIDPQTESIVSRLSYRDLRDDDHGALYKGGSKYGLAEGIVFHNGDILLGLDNNGADVDTDHFLVKKYNLSGNEPAIVTLSLPAGF